MRHLFIPLTLFFSAVVAQNQTEYIDINNVKAGFTADGIFLYDALNAKPLFEAPRSSGLTTVFASALWIGGVDAGGALKLAAQTYRQVGSDYWPGPLDTLTGLTDTVTATQWDKVWKVSRSEIEVLRNDPNYPNPSSIHPAIQTWPLFSQDWPIRQRVFLKVRPS